jgi:hypothetical protein
LAQRIHRLTAIFFWPGKGEVTRIVQSAMPTPHLFERTLLGMCAVIRAAKAALWQVFFEPDANFLPEALFFAGVIQVHVATIRTLRTTPSASFSEYSKSTMATKARRHYCLVEISADLENYDLKLGKLLEGAELHEAREHAAVNLRSRAGITTVAILRWGRTP